MNIVMTSEYGGEPKVYPLNDMEDLADFLNEYPSASHAAIAMGLGNLRQMAELACKYLSTHHMDFKIVEDDEV